MKLLFASAIVLAGFGVNAQTVDEIVNKNIEAMGGKEKLASLQTVKMSGTMSAQGTELTLTITKSHLKGMRLDMDINGTSNYQVANTKQGWVFMPVMGMSDPKEMEADQYKSFATQMDIQGALLNYKDKGHTIELAGSEKVEGADAYKLKVTFQNGRVANYFIDKKTNRIIKTSGKTTMNGQEMDVETTLGDYKQNADGYWFPYTITNMQGPITFDKIETNIPVDEKIYSN